MSTRSFFAGPRSGLSICNGSSGWSGSSLFFVMAPITSQPADGVHAAGHKVSDGTNLNWFAVQILECRPVCRNYDSIKSSYQIPSVLSTGSCSSYQIPNAKNCDFEHVL